jgi:hypothetical protein
VLALLCLHGLAHVSRSCWLGLREGKKVARKREKEVAAFRNPRVCRRLSPSPSPLLAPPLASRSIPPLAVNLQPCLILSGLIGHHRRQALALAPQGCFWRLRHGCRWGAPWMGWEQEEATLPTFQVCSSALPSPLSCLLVFFLSDGQHPKGRSKPQVNPLFLDFD